MVTFTKFICLQYSNNMSFQSLFLSHGLHINEVSWNVSLYKIMFIAQNITVTITFHAINSSILYSVNKQKNQLKIWYLLTRKKQLLSNKTVHLYCYKFLNWFQSFNVDNKSCKPGFVQDLCCQLDVFLLFLQCFHYCLNDIHLKVFIYTSKSSYTASYCNIAT